MFGAGNNFYTDKPNAIIAAIIMVTFSTIFEPNIFVLLRVMKGKCENKFSFEDAVNEYLSSNQIYSKLQIIVKSRHTDF